MMEQEGKADAEEEGYKLIETQQYTHGQSFLQGLMCTECSLAILLFLRQPVTSFDPSLVECPLL